MAVNNFLIHADARAVISPYVATLDGVSFQVAQITSARVACRSDGGFGCGVLMLGIVGAALLAFAALALTGAYHKGDIDPFEIWILSVFGFIGVVFLWWGGRRASRSDVYMLIIIGAGGESAAISDTDRAYIEQLRCAIEQAMIMCRDYSSLAGRQPQ